MTRYNDELWDLEGDIHEALHDQVILGYREGVDRVVEYVKSTWAYPKLDGELQWAISQGII